MSSLIGSYKTSIEVSNLAEGDSIASYLTDAAGNLLTSTLVSGKQSLDVNVTQSALPTGAATETTSAAILAELESITFAEDTAHASGDKGVMGLAVRNDADTSLVSADGDYAPLQVDSLGRLKVVSDLDVDFDFVYAEDSVHASGDLGSFSLAVRRDVRSSGVSADGDYGSFNVNAVGELWVKDADALAQLVLANSSLDAIEASAAAIESDVDAIRIELLDQGVTLDSILADTATIDSQTLNISNVITALSKAEDAVHASGDQGIQALAVRKDSSGSNAANGDYTSIQTWSEGSVKTVDVANSTILQQGVTVANSATALASSPIASRRNIMVQNQSDKTIYVGSATVTSSGATRGIQVPKGGFIEIDLGPAVVLYGITATGTADVGILEAA